MIGRSRVGALLGYEKNSAQSEKRTVKALKPIINESEGPVYSKSNQSAGSHTSRPKFLAAEFRIFHWLVDSSFAAGSIEEADS